MSRTYASPSRDKLCQAIGLLVRKPRTVNELIGHCQACPSTTQRHVKLLVDEGLATKIDKTVSWNHNMGFLHDGTRLDWLATMLLPHDADSQGGRRASAWRAVLAQRTGDESMRTLLDRAMGMAP